MIGEATAMRGLGNATREQPPPPPLLSQLEKACVQQQGPSAAKK